MLKREKEEMEKCFDKVTKANLLLVKLHLHKNEVDLGSL